MSELSMKRKESNPAQVRGDIQSGRSGDKRYGFDPAMAPLETDAEAAGTPLSPDMIATARADAARGVSDNTAPEYGDAMRRMPGLPHRSKPPSMIFILFSVLLVAATAIALVTLLRQQ
jgi:hypothetical protein